MITTLRAAALAVAMLAAPVAAVHAQQPGQPPAESLSTAVAALDTKLFDAYNHCDLETLGTMVDENLEFYHDQTGLSVGRAPFLDAIKNNICGKVQRVLVPGTLEVYPLKGYGAVEICIHRFTHPGDATNIGEAKSIMLWQLKDGVWHVTRVISFDHHPASR